MPIVNNKGVVLGGKKAPEQSPEEIPFTIEDTDFLIQSLNSVEIPIAKAKIAWGVLDKIVKMHNKLMKKTVKL